MKKISFGESVKVGKRVRFFGHVIIGKNVIIDDGVSIGYPRFDTKDFSHHDCVELDTSLEMIAINSGSTTVIGDNSIIRSGTTIYEGTQIGSNLDCAHNCIIREHVSIGKNAYLKVGCQLKPHAKIGNNVVLSGLLGDRVVVHDNVTTHGQLIHSYSTGKRYEVEAAPVLKFGCFVGRGAIVVGDVTIGERAQIAAGALVLTDIPEFAQVRSEKSKIFENESTLKK